MISLRNVPSVDFFELASNFDALRRQLLGGRYEDRLSKPLAWWTLPGDRRLPLALLDRKLGDLLNMPFGQISATPGIGHKKMASLVKLIERATHDDPPTQPLGGDHHDESILPTAHATANLSEFDPALVSEALWAQWQETVRDHHAGHETIGRLAPRLGDVPTVIWSTPLSDYLTKSLRQIRHLKTHGEKRVRVVLEVFHGVQRALTDPTAESHLDSQLCPKFIAPIERAIDGWLAREKPPTMEEVRDQLAIPLLDQIEADGDATLRKLCETRIGTEGTFPSVRSQSRKLGVTRARVYQLLEECGKMIQIRWPEGREKLAQLSAYLAQHSAEAWAQTICRSVCTLFYPTKK